MSNAPRSPYAIPHVQANWDWRAAGNFIGGGTGGGLLVAGLFLCLQGLPVWPVALSGGAFIGLGLGCVWLEIGKPWRAINVFFHPQTSWMTREGILALFLYIFGTGAFLTGSVGLLAIMAVTACGFVYAQARILRAAKGIPAWRTNPVTPLILSTSLAEGGGLAILLASAFGFALPSLPLAAVALLGLRAAVWRIYLRQLSTGCAPKAAADAARALDLPLLVLGHGLPAALLLVGHPLLAIGGGLLAALGGWALKYVLVTRLSVTQGFALPVSPARGRGTSGPGIRPGWSESP